MPAEQIRRRIRVEELMSLLTKMMTAALIAGRVSSLPGSADAVPLGASLSLRDASTPMVQTVRWRGGGWFGLGLGLAAGAAIASSYRYNYGYYGAYSYGYASPYYGYAYRPRVYVRRAWARW